MTQKRRTGIGWGVWLVAAALVGVAAGAWAQKAPGRGSARAQKEAPEPLEVPRLDQDLEFSDDDLRKVLRLLFQNATPRYTPELDRAGLTGPVRVTLSFTAGTELEEAVRAVLAEGVRRKGPDLSYRFDTRLRRFVLLREALTPTRTFRTTPKDDAPPPTEVRGTVRLPEIVLPASHTEDVNGIATSPDGKLVATSSDEDLVVLWEGGRLLRTFSGQISRRAFSPDGKTLHIFRDRQVIPFDVATGQPGKTRTFSARVLAVSCSDDGKVLVSLDNKRVHLCQGPNLVELRLPFQVNLHARFLIGASGLWAVGAPDGAEPATAARLLDLTSGKLNTIPFNERVSDVDISPDDRFVAIGTDLARVVVARVEDRRPFLASVCVGEKRDPLTEAGLTAPPANFDWTPASVAFGPGGRLAASAEGAQVWVWNVRDTAPPLLLPGHRMRFYNLGCRSLAFDREGRLYSGSRGAVEDDEALLKLWDTAGGRLAGTLPGAEERLVPRVERIALSLDSQQIVASGKGGIQLWDLKLRRPPRRLMSGLPLAVSPDGFWMAARSVDPPVPSVLPPPELRDALLGALPGGAQDPRRIAEEARRLKTKVRGVTITHLGSEEGALLTAPSRLTKGLTPFAGAGGQCQAIAWYPHMDSNLVAVSGWDDRIVYLFDVTGESKVPRRVFHGGHTMPVTELLFSAGGRFLVSRATGRDGKSEVCVWETATGKLRATPGRDLVRQDTPPLKEGEEAEPLAFLPGSSRTPWKDFPTAEIERIVLNPGTPDLRAIPEDYPQFLVVSALIRNPEGGEARQIRLYHLDTGLLMGTVDGRFPRFTDDSLWLMAVKEKGHNASDLLAWDLTQGRRGEPPPPRRIFLDTGEVLATRPNLLVCRAPNRRDIVLHFDNDARRILTGHSAPVESALFDPRDGRIWSAARDGTIRLWSPAGEGIATLVLTGEGSDHLITLADQSYLATRGALRAVAFRVGDRTYPFDQFDLHLNRPHVVLERLGATDLKLIERKRTAWQWRRDKAKLGDRTLEELLADIPTVELEEEPLATVPATQATVRLSVKASDPKGQGLERLRVLVNDVPVPLPESVETLQGAAVSRTVDIPLVPGRNKIQVSVVNASKVESLRIVRNVVWNAPPRNPVLYVVAVGVSKYANGEDLRYAASDAAAMAASLKRLEKVAAPPRPPAADPLRGPLFGVRYQKVVTLVLPQREATRKVFRERIEAFLKAARPEDHVLLYLSGHGLLDPASQEYRFCTVDWDNAALADTTVRMGEIDDLLAGCGARQKVILVDTCFSGKYFNPADYGVSGEDLEKVVGESFVDIAEGSGAQILAAASGGQTAREGGKDASGKALRAGLFTSWLKGALERDPKRPGTWRADRGDDARRPVSDGRVTVRELFRYVAAAASGNPGQRPALARESLEFDFPLLVGRAPSPPGAAPRRSRTAPRR